MLFLLIDPKKKATGRRSLGEISTQSLGGRAVTLPKDPVVGGLSLPVWPCGTVFCCGGSFPVCVALWDWHWGSELSSKDIV